MKWYIIRHAETELNKEGVLQGSGIDADINNHGSKQSKQFYELYKHIKFDKIYISTLKRTAQSFAYFINKFPSEKLSALDEINWGIYDGEKLNNCSDYFETLQIWKNGNIHYQIKGGESPLEVAHRQKKAIDLILKQDYENILVGMHGRAMRILLSQLLNTPISEMDQYEHSNMCLYLIEWNGCDLKLLIKNKPLQLI